MNNLVEKKSFMQVTQSPINIEHSDLTNYLLKVPLYQREYAWELDEVSDLFYDIQNSDEGQGHFLGSILLSDKGNKVKEVIDGQQRLTTMFLILYAIRKTLNNSEDGKDRRITETANRIDEIIYLRKKDPTIRDESTEPRLVTGFRDNKLFRSILQNKNDNKKGKQKSHKLLLNAINDFIEPKIIEIRNQGIEQLFLFYRKVTSCQYIVMTAQEKEDERLLFKTLNSRGVALSESDLIKNEVCTNIKGDNEESAISQAVSIWNEIRQSMESKNVNIDLFLYHYINSLDDAIGIRSKIEIGKRKQNNDGRIPESQENLTFYPPISEKLFFTAYELKIKEINNTIEFLEDLKKASDLYIEIAAPLEPSDTTKKIEKMTLFSLKGLKALNNTKCYPLLLRGKNVLNDNNFFRLVQAIECLSFRHSIQKNEPKELEKFYYDILKILKTDENIDEIINLIKEHTTIKNEAEFETQFIKLAPKSSVSKFILQRIIFKTQSLIINISSKTTWLEHIMPQTPAGEWLALSKEKETYENNLERIGNLCLLQYDKNIGAGNKDFEIKKTIYNNSGFNENKILVNYSEWNFESIEKRQIDLFNHVKEIWKIL